MQYSGQIVDGQMHGEGRVVYENGEEYSGQWNRGKDMVLVYISIMMDQDLMVIGITIRLMVLVHHGILMVMYIVENGLMEELMVKVH